MFNNQTLFANKLQKQQETQKDNPQYTSVVDEASQNDNTNPEVDNGSGGAGESIPTVTQTIDTSEQDKNQWLEKIVNTMLAYDITPKEARKAYYDRARNKTRKVPPKWKGPEGQLWSGRGRKPVWFREAENNGTVENYRL